MTANKCNQCENVFSLTGNLKIHLKTHSQTAVMTADKCNNVRMYLIGQFEDTPENFEKGVTWMILVQLNPGRR